MSDNKIALALQPLQIESPIDQYAKVSQIAGLQQRRQLQAQQMEHSRLQIEEQKRGVAEQEALSEIAHRKADDIPGMLDEAGRHPLIRPQTVAKVRDEFNKAAEAQAKRTAEEAKNTEGMNADVVDALLATKRLPPEQQQANYEARQRDIATKWKIPPKQLVPFDPTDAQFLDSQLARTQTESGIMKLAGEKRAQATADAAAKKAAHDQAMFPAEESKVASEAALKTGEVDTKKTQSIAETLANSTDQADYAAKLSGLDAKTAAKFPPVFDKAKVLEVATTPEQRIVGLRAANVATEAHRHNLSVESTARYRAGIAAGRLAQEQMVNGMKYGPGTQEYWVKQLQDNPDSVKEMPPEFRSAVGQKFREMTGLPLPTPLAGATQVQETAARNALDGIDFIKKALTNPEIQKNIGPIMGRLGNAEQRVGTAVGMSPEAEALAQELRTRMRYFVFQEGKAVLGGRLPQQLMKELEASSANVKMDPDMLKGALNGAEGNAHSVMDNADKQRFGGKMRTREMRGLPSQNPAGDLSGLSTEELFKRLNAGGK